MSESKGSRARPKATSLLLARRCWYGGLEMRIGVPADQQAIPAVTPGDNERATREAHRLLRGADFAPDAAAAASFWLSLHHAAERRLEATLLRKQEANHLRSMPVGDLPPGGLSPEQNELLRLDRAGLLAPPICLPLGSDRFVSIATPSSAGAIHHDLLGFTALLLKETLRAGSLDRKKGSIGRIDEALGDLFGVDADWLRQRASMLLAEVRRAAREQAALFDPAPAQLLSALVPLNVEDAFSVAPLKLRPLYLGLPGMTDTSGRLRRPSPENRGVSAVIPSWLIPWLAPLPSRGRRRART